MNARQKQIALIEELAAKHFKDHRIDRFLGEKTAFHEGGGIVEVFNQKLHRCYHCNNGRGDFCYSFRLITYPGGLMVTGDVGFLVVERVSDMFLWTPGAAESIDYLAEKVPAEIPTREYDGRVAREWLAEMEGQDETHDAADKLYRYDPDNEWEFGLAIRDSGIVDGCDWPDFKNWKPSFLWCREAVRWFFRNLKEKESGPTESKQNVADG